MNQLHHIWLYYAKCNLIHTIVLAAADWLSRWHISLSGEKTTATTTTTNSYSQ